MIQSHSIQKVIERADIVEVIGQFLNLKRRGVNYITQCPFHNEKTPSFNVNPSRGIFKCFGCGKGGDVVTFIEEYEKFSFVEAIRWLAEYYQIELEETEDTHEVKQSHQLEESLRVINEFAAKYFHDLLSNNEEGRIVGKGYFTERGFTDDTIEEFQLGYCLDDWDSFTNAALTKGFDKNLLEKSGLIKIKNDKAYDNYKGRAIFPIFSATGKILGFGARILKKNDKAPKYVNTPENELYVKNKVLYGLYQSRQSIRKEDECFLVEGYTDVISLHQGGIKNVVASSGTSLTDGQLRLMANLSKNLTILYDGDAAGIKAALRGLDMALEQSFRVRLVLLPEGEDPDSFMQSRGTKAFKEYIEGRRQDVISFHLEIGLRDAGNDPIRKAALVNEVAETISKINKAEDFSLQQHYIRECAAKLDIEEEGLVHLVNKFIRERIQKDQRQKEKPEIVPPEPVPIPRVDGAGTLPAELDAQQLLSNQHKEEWQLIRILLEYGGLSYEDNKTVADYFFETIDPEILEDPLARKMTMAYDQFWAEKGKLPDESFFIKHPDKNIRHKAVDLFYEKYYPSPDWENRYRIEVPYGSAIYLQEVKSTFAYFELKFIRRLIMENGRRLKAEKDAQQMTALMKIHMELKKREKALLSVVIVK
ncbi:MAG TPA: DNA primase [Edaphocola sp.]|nr:DNA primase [Edaphocola sp.]